MATRLVEAQSEKRRIQTERIKLESEFLNAGRQLETRSNSIAELANEMVKIEQHLSGVSAVLEVARKREETAITTVAKLEKIKGAKELG